MRETRTFTEQKTISGKLTLWLKVVRYFLLMLLRNEAYISAIPKISGAHEVEACVDLFTNTMGQTL